MQQVQFLTESIVSHFSGPSLVVSNILFNRLFHPPLYLFHILLASLAVYRVHQIMFKHGVVSMINLLRRATSRAEDLCTRLVRNPSLGNQISVALYRQKKTPYFKERKTCVKLTYHFEVLEVKFGKNLQILFLQFEVDLKYKSTFNYLIQNNLHAT